MFVLYMPFRVAMRVASCYAMSLRNLSGNTSGDDFIMTLISMCSNSHDVGSYVDMHCMSILLSVV